MQGETMALSHEYAHSSQKPSVVLGEAASLESDPSESQDSMDASRESAPERRTSGKRMRARDRVMDRANHRNFSDRGLEKQGKRSAHLENMLLFIDDDLRETALAVARVEQFLVDALEVLERPGLPRKEVHALANNTQVLDHLDDLNTTVESLRRRMAQLASTLKS